MMKDPLDTEENPYEQLGVPPIASIAEVGNALPVFMRNPRNRPRMGLAQEASKKLKNPTARTVVDLGLYPVDLSGVDAGEERELPLDTFWELPHAPLESFPTDLDGGDWSADFRPVEAARVQVSDLKRYDGLDRWEWKPVLDR